MNKLVLKRCDNCGAMVEVLQDCTCQNCGIKCCGKAMGEVIPNSTDASAEKHTPVIEIVDNNVIARVNHPMDKEHYIEWIALCNDNTIERKLLAAEQSPVAVFPYIAGSKIMAYCNKHGLWSIDIK